MSTAENLEPATPGDGDTSRSRQCGRCQQAFPADPALHPTAQPGWWLCSPCHDALIGPARG